MGGLVQMLLKKPAVFDQHLPTSAWDFIGQGVVFWPLSEAISACEKRGQWRPALLLLNQLTEEELEAIH